VFAVHHEVGGDTAVFSSGNPITIQANGTCTTEVHADADGRLIRASTGSSYTLSVPAGLLGLEHEGVHRHIS